jgi:hypothetical protein
MKIDLADGLIGGGLVALAIAAVWLLGWAGLLGIVGGCAIGAGIMLELRGDREQQP